MKSLLAILALTASFSISAEVIQEELFVVGNDESLINELSSHGDIVIDHVSSAGFEVYGPAGLKKMLDERGVRTVSVKVPKQVAANYPTYTQITTKLQDLANRYPNLVRLTSIGKTVRNRDMWMVKISDNPELDEVEPEVKYISSMHGDEITGRELTILLMEEMLSKYGTDQEITNLINNSEIYIMPSMNPDGSELRQRANASGYDLNRNFPEMVQRQPNTTTGKQIETQNVMRFQATRNFALSANFHGGSVVVNYPWDAKYDAHPFDGLVRELSLGYASLNPEMRTSREFTNGITNGADWYVVTGGMQDWSYNWHNDLQVTVELSGQKWPSYSQIPAYYRSNRDSMIYYLKAVHQGAGVKFANRSFAGRVQILDKSSGRDLGTYSFQNGEFYKVLDVGSYTFKVLDATRNVVLGSYDLTVDTAIDPNGNYVLATSQRRR